MSLLTGKLFFLRNDIFPSGGLLITKASHSSDENKAKRTNIQIKQGNTFDTISLRGISFSGRATMIWFCVRLLLCH